MILEMPQIAIDRAFAGLVGEAIEVLPVQKLEVIIAEMRAENEPWQFTPREALEEYFDNPVEG